MSFRLFIYYCALCGGSGAFVGWATGRCFDIRSEYMGTGLKGLWLGVTVALVLSIVDVLWSGKSRQVLSGVARVLVAVLIGGVGGFVGGVIGQALYNRWPFLFVFGWTVTGTLIGLAVCIYDLLEATWESQDQAGPLKKVVHGVVGGALGGFVGGLLSLASGRVLTGVLRGKPEELWSPSAWGFVVLGACIGLLIALTQVILKEAWVKVEAGFRAGREQILAKPIVTIGRGEGCDVGLFGDPAIDRLHARILREGDGYVVTDAESSTGTFVNGERLDGPRSLRSGDVIRVGRCVLRFGERAKQAGR